MSKDEWTEVIASDNKMWDKKAPIIGVLVGKKENVGPNESMLYTIKTDDGNVGVWGSTVLDNKFVEIPLGFKVKIEPVGLVKSPKTGREYQDFKVMYKPFEGWEAGAKPKLESEKIEDPFENQEMPEEFLQ